MSGYLSLKMSNAEQVSPNLYIVGLPLDFNENDLYELCSKTANVVECKCLEPKEGKTTKAGFANFESIEDSQKAFSFFSFKENNPLQLVIRYSRRYVQSKVSAQVTQGFSSDKPSFSQPKSVNSRSPMEGPTRSAESPLFNDGEDNFQMSPTPSYSEDTYSGFKEYSNLHHQQPIISFPETPRAMSIMSQFELLRNIHNFQSGKEKSVEYRGKDIVISLRNDINVRPHVETKIICVICCTSANFSCARCKSVNYCGVNCQIFDWVENDHRTDCLKDERPTPFQCFSKTSSISSLDASTNNNYMASVEGASAFALRSSARSHRIRHKYIANTPLRKPRVFDSVAAQKSPGEPTLPTVRPENTQINMATLPRQCLREGDKVVACFGSNPYKFYVQKFSDLDELSFIMNKLNGESLESIPIVQLNSFCAAKYIDGKWYRAKIEKVSDDRQNVEAFFFDFGNTDVVQISNLCKIHIDLLNFSAKAYSVRLLKVKPLNHAKDFSSETLQKISELLAVPYTVKKSIYTIEGIFTVELEDDNGNNLSNLLLEEKIVDPVSVYLMKTEKRTAKADVDKKPSVMKLQEQFLNCADEVFLCYGNNPHNFYVQKSLDLEELRIIHNFLLKESSEASSFGNCTVGSICAAKYTNGIWYRAKIILKLPNAMYKVYFIDFGNVEVLSSSDLICISSKLSFSPKAFRCCLYKANCNVFTELVENELQAFGAVVKEVHKKGHTYEVELISQISKEDVSALLNKSLVMEHDQLKRGNEKKQDPLNMNPGLGASSKVIENHFPIVEVEPITENAPQKSASKSTGNLAELPNQSLVPGDKVLFCNGRNPCRFYVHKMSEVEEFSLLTETLQTSSENVSVHPEVGLICSTLYEDGLLYRSRIMKILGDGNVEVFFVDFGNTFIGNPSSLRPLPKLLSKYSAKAYCLQLKVQPLKGDTEFSNDVQNVFHSIINDAELVVINIFYKGNSFVVDLKDEQDNNIIDLLTSLVEPIANVTVPSAEDEKATPLTLPSAEDEKATPLTVTSAKGEKATSLTVPSAEGEKATSLTVISAEGEKATSLTVPSPKNSNVTPLSVSNLENEKVTSTVISPVQEKNYSCQIQQKVTPVVDIYPKEPRCTLISNLPEQTLQIGDRVTLVYGKNPSNFYVNKMSELNEIKMISESLQAKMTLEKKVPIVPRVGLMCSALFKDLLWYRAKIQKILDNGNVEIIFVDFGNKAVNSDSELRELPMDFLSHSAMAYCLKLRVKPLNEDKDFSIEVQDAFHSFIDGYPLIIKGCVQNGSIFVVDLKDEEENDIGNLLVTAELADPISDNCISQPSKKEVVVVTKTVINPEKSVPSTTPLLAFTIPNLPQQILTSGDKVMLVHGKNPSNFYVNKMSDIDEMKVISNTLQSQMLVRTGATFVPQVGLMCSALFEDNLWYRGIVQKVLEDGKAEILFIDFGNEVVCSAIELHELPKDLLSYSAKAYPLKLKVQPLNGAPEFPDEVQKTFHSFIDGYTLIVKESVQSGSSFIIDLKDEEENDIVDFMISNKLAVPIRYMSGPKDNFTSTTTNIRPITNEADVISKPVIIPEKISVETEKPSTTPVLDIASIADLPPQSLSSGDKVALVFENDPLSFYVNKLSDFDDIRSISECLQTQMSATIHDPFTPKDGVLCSAKFKEDGLWYRARILNVLSDGIGKVLFLDCGNNEIVELSTLHALPKDLLMYCAKAYCLKLKVKPLNCKSKFSNDVKMAFNDLIKGYPLIVKEAWKTDTQFIVNLKDEESNDIADLLIRNQLALPGLAQMVDMPSPNESELAPQPTSLSTSESVLCELPKQTLNSEDKVIIVYGSDPTKFYAQKLSDANDINAITEALKVQLSLNVQTPLIPEVGLVCSALFQDGLLYRARITEVLEGGKVKVFFIDYGNEDITELSSLQPLPKELLSYSEKAYCLMLKIKPANNKSDFSIYLKETFVALINKTTLKIKEFSKIECSFIVELEDEKCNDIAKFLVDTQFAELSEPSHASVLTTSVVLYSANVAIYKESDLPLPHLDLGDIVELVYSNNPINFYVQNYSDTDKLEKITDIIKSKVVETDSSLFCPEAGNLCLAKFEDDVWYRGKIEKDLGNENYQVFFLDFGNSACANKSQIKQFPKELLIFSPQAVRCKLRVRPLDNCSEFPQQARDSFALLVTGLQLKVTMKDDIDIRGIIAVDLKDQNHGDISKLMVCNGLAVPLDALDFNPLFITLPKQTLNPRDQIITSYFDSPASFYVTKTSDTDEICKISKFLKEMQPSPKPSDFIPMHGILCIAKYVDGDWYRGRVTKIINNGNIQVFFMDYGNTEIVNPNSIAALPEKLLKHSAKIYHLRLNKIKPANSLKEFSVQAITRCCALLQDIPLIVTSVSENGYFFDVSLINKANKDLSDILVEEKYAEYVETKPVESIFHSASLKTEPDLTSTTPKQIIKDSDNIQPNPVYQALRPTLPKMTFMEGRPLTLPLEQLQIGVEYNVSVSWIAPPVVYIQLHSKFADFQELDMNLRKYSGSQKHDNEHLPKVGDYVCSKFNDGKWYRSIVLSVRTPDFVEVFFVDYGNSHVVMRKDILPLPISTFKIPLLAHCVCIEGVKEINEEFAGFLLNEKWKMLVTSFGTEKNLSHVEATVTLKSDSELTNKMFRCQIHPASSLNIKSISRGKFETNMKKKSTIATRSFITDDEISLEVLEVSDTNALACRIVDEKDPITYINLMEEIQNYCSRTNQTLNYKPVIRDFVLAKNPDDEKWYRATVVKPVKGKLKVEVFYTDLSVYGSIPATDILPMTEKLASVSSLGLLCSIYGINVENWENILDQLQMFLKKSNNIIKARVHNFEGSNNICSIIIKEFKV